MRRMSLLIAAGTCVAFAVPASAQTAPTRSVDDYLCAFAGKCGDQPTASDESKDAPETKGFNLGVKRTGTATAATPTTTSRTPVPTRNVARPVQSANRAVRAPVRTAGRTPQGRFTVGTQAPQKRLDLRLSFLKNSAELTPQAREEARVFARALQIPELAGKRFLIEGHTDSSGSRAINLGLSQRRAAAVAEFLAAQGVSRERLDVRGFGPDRPIQGRQASDPSNRRVEAALL